MGKKAILALTAVIALILCLCCGCTGEQNASYRTIQVLEVIGTVTVERSGVGEVEAYAGMKLQSDDSISVAEDSWLKIKMDEDKYALVEPLSELRLEATGNSADSNTVIHLEAGAITSRLESELSEDSVYEVTTPNSTMAVRGTVFRVEVTYGDDGRSITKARVYEGTVGSRLIYPDGTIDPEEETVVINKGYGVEVWGTEITSYYVGEGTPNDHKELLRKTLQFLEEAYKAGMDLSISQEMLEELIDMLENEVGYTVTFMYEGEVFATQKVLENETAAPTLLMPTPSGKWDFDFETPITENTIIEWVDAAS